MLDTCTMYKLAQMRLLFLQETFPAKAKGVYFLNPPRIFSYFFGIVKPLLKDKIKKRVCNKELL